MDQIGFSSIFPTVLVNGSAVAAFLVLRNPADGGSLLSLLFSMELMMGILDKGSAIASGHFVDQQMEEHRYLCLLNHSKQVSSKDP